MQPAVLIVHGSWHTPLHYKPLIDSLEGRGFHVSVPRLPSANGARPPTAVLQDDIDSIQQAATALVNQGRQVLVLAHSYGGIVASNAINTALSISSRTKDDLAGGIVALVYLCAFLPDVGDTLISLKEGIPDQMQVDMHPDGSVTCTNPLDSFFIGIDPSTAQDLIAALVPQPGVCYVTPSTYAAWKHFPTTCICSEQDRAVSFELQMRMVEGVRKAGVDVTLETLAAGHSPFLTHGPQLVELIWQAWKRSS